MQSATSYDDPRSQRPGTEPASNRQNIERSVKRRRFKPITMPLPDVLGLVIFVSYWVWFFWLFGAFSR